MSRYEAVKRDLLAHPRRWLVTGAAGFIGSNLAEQLLGLGQEVVGMDDFSTGKPENLDDIRRRVTADQWSRFYFIEGDIRDAAVFGSLPRVDWVLDAAAIPSVLAGVDGRTSSRELIEHNLYGTVNMLEKLVRQRSPRMLAVAMDSTTRTFRKEVYAEYKAHRPPQPPDLASQMVRCRQIVDAFGIPVFQQEGFEADDLIASAVGQARDRKLRVVIVSADTPELTELDLAIVVGIGLQVRDGLKRSGVAILIDDDFLMP